jgi:hypothetical protein
MCLSWRLSTASRTQWLSRAHVCMASPHVSRCKWFLIIDEWATWTHHWVRASKMTSGEASFLLVYVHPCFDQYGKAPYATQLMDLETDKPLTPQAHLTDQTVRTWVEWHLYPLLRKNLPTQISIRIKHLFWFWMTDFLGKCSFQLQNQGYHFLSVPTCSKVYRYNSLFHC